MTITLRRCELFPAPLAEPTPSHCAVETAVTLLTPILSRLVRQHNSLSGSEALLRRREEPLSPDHSALTPLYPRTLTVAAQKKDVSVERLSETYDVLACGAGSWESPCRARSHTLVGTSQPINYHNSIVSETVLRNFILHQSSR